MASSAPASRELPKRASLVHNAFNRSIANVLKPVDSQTLSEAFPYSTAAMIQGLSDQTRTLFTHYAKDRWEAASEEASFKSLCDHFDRLESEAMDRVHSNPTQPLSRQITRDPKLSIPPLVTGTLRSILELYRSRLAQQNERNARIQASLASRILEIERAEKSINTRLDAINSSLEQFSSLNSPPG